MQNKNFHLIDLISQGTAVERILKEKPKEEWIEWLSSKGKVEPIENVVSGALKTYYFVSKTGRECCFFIDDEGLGFIGDHTIFSPEKKRKIMVPIHLKKFKQRPER